MSFNHLNPLLKVFHIALLLIKEIISQQKKHGNGPTLVGLNNVPLILKRSM